jgi:signal transduction histidine kinase
MAPRPSPPRRTIRLRLTALYTSVFLVSSAGLLTIAYLLVRSTLEHHHPYRDALLRLGLHPAPGSSIYGLREGSRTEKIVRAVANQLTHSALHRLLLEYVIALVVITLFSVIIGWLVAGRALAPLRRITATARRVSGENLGERIGLAGPDDELKELADTFDGMLGRLDAAFASQRHFVANASHELRTPLAIMRTEVDVALADPEASAEDLREMADAIRETVDRCERLIGSLLVLARSEAAGGPEEPVDLAAIAGDCVTDLSARAQEAGVAVRAQLPPAWVDGHPGLIERMVANLLDNGIRHNVPGGRLAVTTESRDATVRLIVANGGPRIQSDDVAGLTTPFRRLDRSVSGFGLGLSIVRSVVEAHHGTAELTAPADGGLVVTITLPARREGADPADPQFLLTRS